MRYLAAPTRLQPGGNRMTRIYSYDEYREMTFEAVEDFNRKDYNKALEKFLDLAETNPNNPKVHEILVLIYLKLDMLGKAQEEFEAYHRLLGESIPGLTLPVRKSFNQLATEAGDQVELERACEAIMSGSEKLDPWQSTDTVSKLGIVYMSQGEYRKAEELLLEFKQKLLDNCPAELRENIAV